MKTILHDHGLSLNLKGRLQDKFMSEVIAEYCTEKLSLMTANMSMVDKYNLFGIVDTGQTSYIDLSTESGACKRACSLFVS